VFSIAEVAGFIDAALAEIGGVFWYTPMQVHGMPPPAARPAACLPACPT
jgi:hypothetical protein